MIQLSMISTGVGLGFTYNGETSSEQEYLDQRAIKIGLDTIQIGEKTTLNNIFETPLRYCGVLKNHLGTIISFHLGETINSYGEVSQYYSCYIVETENRLLNLSSMGEYKKLVLLDNKWKELYA